MASSRNPNRWAEILTEEILTIKYDKNQQESTVLAVEKSLSTAIGYKSHASLHRWRTRRELPPNYSIVENLALALRKRGRLQGTLLEEFLQTGDPRDADSVIKAQAKKKQAKEQREAEDEYSQVIIPAAMKVEAIMRILELQGEPQYLDYFAILQHLSKFHLVGQEWSELQTHWEKLRKSNRILAPDLLVKISIFVAHYLGYAGYFWYRLKVGKLGIKLAQKYQLRTQLLLGYTDIYSWMSMEVYRDTRHMDIVWQYLKDAEKLALEMKNFDALVLTHTFMARWCLLNNTTSQEQRIITAQELIKHDESRGISPAIQARKFRIAGDIAKEQRKLDLALENYQQSYQAERTFMKGKYSDMVSSGVLIAEMYRELGNVDLAEQHYETLRAEIPLCFGRLETADFEFGLAKLAWKQEKIAAAFQHTEAALKELDPVEIKPVLYNEILAWKTEYLTGKPLIS